MGNRLENIRVAAIMTDGFEQIEFEAPRDALVEEGAIVHILAPAERAEEHIVFGMNHLHRGSDFEIDSTVEEANPADYDAVFLPGGVVNADKLRTHEPTRNFVRMINEENKPIFAICHAPWVLISSGLVRGRELTSYHTIKDDLINAGAHWKDQPLVLDDNLVTSRHPGDIPHFTEQMINTLSQVARVEHSHTQRSWDLE